jgi:hypothetical protein
MITLVTAAWLILLAPCSAGAAPAPVAVPIGNGHQPPAAATPTPVANLTAALQRTVTLLALSGSGLLAVVWTRVALSWFSNDVAKKVQAKDRARDALIGTVIFLAAVSGLLWGVAHWVVTGT